MSIFSKSNLIQMSILDLVEAINDNIIKLPLYQREAVWSDGRICALWDTLLRGFPLPSLLFIRGKGLSRELQHSKLTPSGKSVDNINNYFDNYYDILDGQQRIAAINMVYSYKEDHTVRLWIDLGQHYDSNKIHPLKFKYAILACNKVFPFGYDVNANSEYEFDVLSDNDLRRIWDRIQKNQRYRHLAKKPFYDLKLDNTCPFKAGCPVPLDELVKLVSDGIETKKELLIFQINELAEKYFDIYKELLNAPTDVNQQTISNVAEGLLRLKQYKIAIQLYDLDIDDSSQENDYILYERIGRSGIQITNRQLAVSEIMLHLGKEGANAVASFQESGNLQHLLDREEIIHGLARVAYAIVSLQDDNLQLSEANLLKDENDLVNLTTERLKSIKKKAVWKKLITEIKNYCMPLKDYDHNTMIQESFSKLYDLLRYNEKNNPMGFSLVQLAQPDREREGISPITLHPLLYRIIHNKGKIDNGERDDMLRWILFANGITNLPKHPKLNRDFFLKLVISNREFKFSQVEGILSDDEKLRYDLGVKWGQPSISTEGQLVWQDHDSKFLPTPEEIVDFTTRRFLLNNQADSKVNRFILLWNQREAMEHFYKDIKYIPALFSKGRPFDIDHIVARNHLLYISIKNELIKNGISSIFKNKNHKLISEELFDELFNNGYKWNTEEYSFRKSFPYLIGNYRYWPKELNRHDQNDPVVKKMDSLNIKTYLKQIEHPIEEKFQLSDNSSIYSLSSIPEDEINIWSELPPKDQKWTEEPIGKFFWATLSREKYLYNKIYEFIKSKAED
jgi:hypothetical protein